MKGRQQGAARREGERKRSGAHRPSLMSGRGPALERGASMQKRDFQVLGFPPLPGFQKCAYSVPFREPARLCSARSRVLSLCVVYKGFIMFSTNQKGPANTQLTCDYKKKKLK